MKKYINIKSSKLLVESSIKVGDVDYEKKLRRRVVDLHRARDMAAAAKQKAEANGQPDIAQKLEDKIAELDDLLATYNADTIDDEDTVGAQSEPENKNGGDDGDDTEDGDDEGDDDGDNGDGDSDDPEENDNGKQGKGDPGEEPDGDDKGGDGDPLNKDDDDDDEGEGGDPGSKSKQSGSKEDGDDKGGDPGGGGDPGADPETSDNDLDGDGDGGDGDPGKNTDDSDDGDDLGDSEGDDGDDDGSQGSKSKSKGDKKSDSGDTDGDSESDGDDSDESDDSNNNSNEQSDGKKSQSKTKPSLDPNDSNSNSNAQPEYKNPFEDEEDIPAGLGSFGGMGDEPPRDATVDETIELLKTLKGEGREGAIDALKDLIAKRKAANGGATESFHGTGKESLTEAVKRIRDMTDDEFGDYINGVYDLIGQADNVDYVDDIDARKQKIGQWSQDPLAIQELQAEDNLELQRDYQKKKARDAAKARYSNMGTLKDFEMDFYSAINNQIEMVRQEYQSYDEINTEYESEDVVMKADLVKELPAEAIPIVDVYFDVSGSWEDKHIKVGEAAIASVKVFEDQGDLVLNIFYFSNGVDNVSMEHCRALYGKGTCGWPDILQNIKATGAKNVLIISDGDIERLNGQGYGAADHGSLTVEGCVWYLWKDGESSPTCLKKLRGRQGTSQFSFHA